MREKRHQGKVSYLLKGHRLCHIAYYKLKVRKSFENMFQGSI